MSMDLDTFYTGPLVNDWIKHLQQMIKGHVQFVDDGTGLVLRFEAIQESSIKAAFKIAKYLEVSPHTKYMAILLYDEFMYQYFLNVHTTEISSGLQQDQLDKICHKIVSKSKLYLLSCFQLACKMNSSSIKIEILEIINLLQIIDSKTSYTYNMIISSEYEVFKTVGFRMPLNTPLTCIEVLLVVTNCKDKEDYAIALLLLDVAFLQYEKLYTQFQEEILEGNESMTFNKPTLLKSNILFLSAAIVACSMLFRNRGKLEFMEALDILAEKSLSKGTDIFTMANILFEMAISE